MMHIKEHLLPSERVAHVVAAVFLSCYMNGPLRYVKCHMTVLNKTFPSFLLLATCIDMSFKAIHIMVYHVKMWKFITKTYLKLANASSLSMASIAAWTCSTPSSPNMFSTVRNKHQCENADYDAILLLFQHAIQNALS